MKTIIHRSLRLALPLAALTFTSGAHAAPVISNLSGTTAGIFSFKGMGGVVPYQEFGFVLHVADTSDFRLDALLVSFASAVNLGSAMELTAWTTGAGTPQDTLLATFTGPASPSATVATFTPDAPLELAADSDVFFRFIVPTPGGFYRVNGSTDPFAVEDWTFTETYLRSASGPWVAVGNTPQFEVQATAVPEPGAAALLVAAGTLLGLRRRR